jgi:hypothetical protein
MYRMHGECLKHHFSGRRLTSRATVQCDRHLFIILRQLRHLSQHYKCHRLHQMARAICPSDATRRLPAHRHALPKRVSALASRKEVVQELDEIVADFNGHEKMPMVAQLKAACSGKKMLYRSSFVVLLMFWQQWTGTNSINYYAPQIFKQIGLTGPSSGLFVSDTNVRDAYDVVLIPARRRVSTVLSRSSLLRSA